MYDDNLQFTNIKAILARTNNIRIDDEGIHVNKEPVNSTDIINKAYLDNIDTNYKKYNLYTNDITYSNTMNSCNSYINFNDVIISCSLNNAYVINPIDFSVSVILTSTYNVNYHNGNFVDVFTNEQNYYILRTDGTNSSIVYKDINWREIYYTNLQFNRISYLNGHFCGLTSDDVIYKSNNLKDWTTNYVIISSNWNKIIYSTEISKYITLSNNYIAHSTDYTDWTVDILPYNIQWNSILYLDKLYISSNSYIITSSNLDTWTTRTLNLNSLEYNDKTNLFIGISNDKLMTSTDTVNWNTSAVITGTWKQLHIHNNYIISSKNDQFLYVDGIPKEYTLSNIHLYNSIIYRSTSTNNITDKINITAPNSSKYCYYKNISNYNIQLNLNSTGISCVNKENILNIAPNGTVKILFYQNKIYYENSLNIYGTDFYRFDKGLKLNNSSLIYRKIYNISNLNSVTYTKNQLTNGLIIRTNTPNTDYLPLKETLIDSEIQEGDTYMADILNKGNGILTIRTNFNNVDYLTNNDIFIELNANECTRCILVYKNGTFIAYDIRRGQLV